MVEAVFFSEDNSQHMLQGISQKFPKIFTDHVGGVAVGLSVICLPFVSPALRRICLPYVPATSVQVNNVLSALTGRSGRLLDLGSGDGRIVLSAAKAGFQADGVELNPWLVLYSKLQSYRLRFNNRTRFYHQDLWKFNLQPYPNVVIFGVEEMMPELQTKLSRELCDEACVIACRFPLPSWKPDFILGSGVDTVWVYFKNK
uniref:Uncharacterized protein n=1 Tax=Timema cristinae TaxID=61476 RepID=A0A7R9CBL4_TIMCR|nr:unnamed protein product [Timema cristinae]